MKHVELLEQHEARLRLYAGLMEELGTKGEQARAPILELMRREVAETEKLARTHLSELRGDDEREAFRYSLVLMLPYYTHLARLYGRRTRGPAPSHGARSA